ARYIYGKASDARLHPTRYVRRPTIAESRLHSTNLDVLKRSLEEFESTKFFEDVLDKPHARHPGGALDVQKTVYGFIEHDWHCRHLRNCPVRLPILQVTGLLEPLDRGGVQRCRKSRTFTPAVTLVGVYAKPSSSACDFLD